MLNLSFVAYLTKLKSGDAKHIISASLDIATAALQFFPPPLSIISGGISTILNAFISGGSPSTDLVIKDEFKRQEQFIKNAFKEQKRFIKQQFGETAIAEQIIDARSDLETLDLKRDFISPFKQYSAENLEKVASSIVDQIDYFAHRGSAAELRHSFERWCNGQ